MKSFEEYKKRAQESLLIVPPAGMVYAKTDGVYVWDEKGKRYLDGNARAGMMPFGHGQALVKETDEKLREAGVQTFETIGDFWRTTITVAGESYEISPIGLAELLSRLTFGEGKAYAVPQVTGTLATNSVVKFCERLRPDRRIFVSFEGAYHGRSGAALSLTSSWGTQKSWNAPGLQVVHIPFVESEEDADRAIATLTRIDPKAINAIFFEGVQSVGGTRSQSMAVKRVLQFLRDANVLIFCDEIYAGFYRTGKKFSYEHYDFVPDGITLAKVIGQGIPISTAVISKEVFERHGKTREEVCPIGWEGGTFNWTPMAVARGIVLLSHFEKAGIGPHVVEVAEYLELKVRPIIEEFNKLVGKEVLHLTGRGLMRGFCFRDGRKALTGFRNKVSEKMFANGVIFTGTGHALINPTLCFTPPLVIENEHVDEFVSALQKSLKPAWDEIGEK